MAQPFATAQLSAAGTPRRSVAVVMTGIAPVLAASSTLSAFAPPIWPERTGMMCRPSSSMTSTAGSVVLSFTCGAIALTAMPQAPMYKSASAQSKLSCVHWCTGMPLSTGKPSFSCQL